MDAGATADWTLTFDPSAPAGPLPATLLGHYDLSGALFHFDQVPNLASVMKAIGFSEWRVGLGRWEFATQLLPALTDGTSCASQLAALPPACAAPAGSTDLSLIQARDWFTYTDGSPVTAAMTADDTRYALGYVRSVVDVATAFGAAPYLDIDHMPRALAANQTPTRTNALWNDACGVSWTNAVSNEAPADPSVFASAVAGMAKRLVEGSGGEPGRPVRYFEFWNEADVSYAWSTITGGTFGTYLQTAVAALQALDAYRKQTTNADGQAIRIGLGSIASAQIAAMALPQLDQLGVPFDFYSFHSYSDDPLTIVADVQRVAAAAKASAHHQNVELALAEWGPALSSSKLDPSTMDFPLHDATVLALGAAAGLTHAHRSLMWEFLAPGVPNYALVAHDASAKPAYYAYTLLAATIGTGSTSRLAAPGYADGKLDAGMGAYLASVDAKGKVRVLLVNRNTVSRTATVGALPTAVTVFDDPTKAPHAAALSRVVTVPPRSLVLVEE